MVLRSSKGKGKGRPIRHGDQGKLTKRSWMLSTMKAQLEAGMAGAEHDAYLASLAVDNLQKALNYALENRDRATARLLPLGAKLLKVEQELREITRESAAPQQVLLCDAE